MDNHDHHSAEEIVELMDEIGMEFALHTHHPLTHLELGDAAPEAVKQRANCVSWS